MIYNRHRDGKDYKRINLNLDTNYLERLDIFANNIGVSRSSAISIILHDFFVKNPSCLSSLPLIDNVCNIDDSKK